MDIVQSFHSNGFTKEITILGTIDEPLFKANDIAELLDIKQIRTSLIDFDETEKVIRKVDTSGGEQMATFLTESGLYRLLYKSVKPIAKSFRTWVTHVLREIRKTGKYELTKEIQQEYNDKLQIVEKKYKEELDNVKLQKETLEKQLEDKVEIGPFIYIYQTKRAETNQKNLLKIGLTDNTRRREKQFQQVTPNGNMAFRITCHSDNLRLTENWIHSLLKPFRQAGEVFEMSFELAKKWIIHVGHMMKLSQNPNTDDVEAKLSKIVDYENKVLNQEYGFCATKEIETQTEDDYFVTPEEKPINNELNSKFDKYIEECCVLDTFHEVSAKDIEGQYRLWARCADKKTFHALLDYLQTRFKHIRLPNPNPNSKNVVYGYRGLKLKDIPPFTLPFAPTDPENFLAHACIFSPSGKVIMNDILEEYEKWGKSVDKNVDRADLKNYLKHSPRVLISNVWAASGNGQGYYGLSLRKEENINRTSSTAKQVSKRNEDGEVIATWTTIAKAAQDEGLPAAKLSRAIKNGTILNGFRYITS
jgi:prophage antirepressor-like protein